MNVVKYCEAPGRILRIPAQNQWRGDLQRIGYFLIYIIYQETGGKVLLETDTRDSCCMKF